MILTQDSLTALWIELASIVLPIILAKPSEQIPNCTSMAPFAFLSRANLSRLQCRGMLSVAQVSHLEGLSASEIEGHETSRGLKRCKS